MHMISSSHYTGLALDDLCLASLPVGLESELCFQLPQIAKKQASTSGACTGFGSSKAAVSSLWQAANAVMF